MALASASAALPAAVAGEPTTPNTYTQWEFQGYDKTGNDGKKFSLSGKGSGCKNFPNNVYSYNWVPGQVEHEKKKYSCSFKLYKEKDCKGGELYNGPSEAKHGDFSKDEQKAWSIKVEFPY